MKIFDVLCFVVGLAFLPVAGFIGGQHHGRKEVVFDRCSIACGGDKYTRLHYKNEADWRRWYCTCRNNPEEP